MSSSDSQRPPKPAGLLQQRLASQPPPPSAEPARGDAIPEWRGNRFAELAAAEASEYARSKGKPKSGSTPSSPGTLPAESTRVASGAADGGASASTSIARISARPASGAVESLATASFSTAKATADGLGRLAHALWVGLKALARALVVTLDAIGGATLAVPRTIGRGTLALLRRSHRAFDAAREVARPRESHAPAIDPMAAVIAPSPRVIAPSLPAIEPSPPADVLRIPSARRAPRLRPRSVLAVLGGAALVLGAFFAFRAYAPGGRRAAATGGARANAALVTFGSDLHRVLESIGLVDPIPVAADKPEPPPHVPRYALEITTTPDGAIAAFAGQELPTPARFELDALPQGPLRVTLRKPGFVPITRRIEVADFTPDGERLRHSVQLMLRAPAPKAHAGAATTADEVGATSAPTAPTAPGAPKAPDGALPPGTIPLAPARSNGPERSGLFSTRDSSAPPAAP
jgi:hypothetical protein